MFGGRGFFLRFWACRNPIHQSFVFVKRVRLQYLPPSTRAGFDLSKNGDGIELPDLEVAAPSLVL
jgi:hypothetical protein